MVYMMDRKVKLFNDGCTILVGFSGLVFSPELNQKAPGMREGFPVMGVKAILEFVSLAILDEAELTEER